ncbi:MAG: lipocalin family protein [Methylophilaceae bacterium]
MQILISTFKYVSLFICLSFLGCATAMKPIPLVEKVDILKFMGNWYVIASIPTVIEKEAYNGIENYKLNSDGTIATTFTFYKGAFDGPFKKYEPKGFVQKEGNNALWGMQFIWPIKSEFRITYLDDQYQRTIISRNARDYVWIMARTPQISDAQYKELSDIVASYGYDISKLRKVPQQWNAPDKTSK